MTLDDLDFMVITKSAPPFQYSLPRGYEIAHERLAPGEWLEVVKMADDLYNVYVQIRQWSTSMDDCSHVYKAVDRLMASCLVAEFTKDAVL